MTSIADNWLKLKTIQEIANITNSDEHHTLSMRLFF